ncbi:ATP-grasp domain-containing protein [Bosea sp. BK604]|uniref:ATP-grasp domain-containing protein n=1 Tax=Bosea sp. BK604 TaxID=2512180 RepID=UPI001048B12C|nr:ATP-grasp domain-containing protein [Bosea sp. BK604]TCR70006.1 carbamoyl-phosphate synthase large subunit [Bosea sp. BK604]
MSPADTPDTIRVAVTGMGNPLGQNIFKALKMSRLPLELFALDSNPFSAGFFGGATPILCPRADASGYVEELVAFLRRERIAIVFFGTEAEPAKLRGDKARIEAESGAVLMLNDSAVLNVADDKYLTACALAAAGLDHPASAQAEDSEAVEALIARVGFPLIVKPRKGSASRGLARIRGRDELAAQLRPGAVVQECLLPDDAEYTVGIYRCGDGRIAATTVIRRDLDFGLTYRGVVLQHDAIAAYAGKVATALDAKVSCNVQLRLTPRGPVCFEVNPRFSSTTPVRAHFGVNEPELAIREYVLGETLPPISARSGAVMREWREVYLEADEFEAALQRDLSTWKGRP